MSGGGAPRMGKGVQSLADALSFTNQLMAGFNAAKHESTVVGRRNTDSFAPMFPSSYSGPAFKGPSAAAAAVSPARTGDFPKHQGAHSTDSFLSQLLQGRNVPTKDTAFGKVEIGQSTFEWLTKVPPAGGRSSSSAPANATAPSETIQRDAALERTLAATSHTPHVVTTTLLSEADKEEARNKLAAQLKYSERIDTEANRRAAEDVKLSQWTMMREALATIEHERQQRADAELAAAERDENKATVLATKAANAAALELARQQRHREEASALAFLRQQLQEVEDTIADHDNGTRSSAFDDQIRDFTKGIRESGPQRLQKQKQNKYEVEISPRGNTIKYLARTMHVKTEKIINKARTLLEKSDYLTRDSSLDQDVAELLVQEFGHIVVHKQADAAITIKREEYSKLPPRAPVVCVMGHVDHGKTTLLDYLRKTNVVAKEAGAITQGIGAFKVQVHADDQTFTTTFLDTPGHAAFKSMRAKGANTNLTDIIVLVVSAMDGIQPQTEEAIRLARASDIPLVVAINKMDLEGADAEYVRSELKRRGVDVDGSVHAVPISAKEGTGMEELQEAIQMTADELDLRATPDGIMQAFIVESRLDRKSGHCVNVVVRRGTLRTGDYVVSGLQYNKVRFLIDDRGARVNEAGPSIAVSIPSWESLDGLGDELIAVDSESKAKELVAAKRTELEINEDIANDMEVEELKRAQASKPKRELSRSERSQKRIHKEQNRVALQKDLQARDKQVAAEEAKQMKTTLPVIVRSDVSGSIKVFLDYIQQLPSDEVKIMVIKSGLGEVTDIDVKMAADFNASIYAFNVKTKANVSAGAKSQNIPFFEQTVMYHLFDDMRTELGKLLPSNTEQVQTGMAEVKQVFALKSGPNDQNYVAGCIITNGKLSYKGTYEVFRYKKKIWSGKLASLRHHKTEVQELEKDTECGIVFAAADGVPIPEIEVGDTLRCFVTRQRDRMLDDTDARQFSNYESIAEAQQSTLEHRVTHAPLIRET